MFSTAQSEEILHVGGRLVALSPARDPDDHLSPRSRFAAAHGGVDTELRNVAPDAATAPSHDLSHDGGHKEPPEATERGPHGSRKCRLSLIGPPLAEVAESRWRGRGPLRPPRPPAFVQSTEVASDLRHPIPVGLGGDAGDVNTSGLEVDARRWNLYGDIP